MRTNDKTRLLSTPDTQDFFSSVRGAFGDNERTAHQYGRSLTIALVALCALGLLYALLRPALKRWKAKRRERAAFAEVIAFRGLKEADIELVRSLALHAATSPLWVATHIDVFERATASKLRGRPPVVSVSEGDIYSRTRALREALGFSSHELHLPLLTTRELMPGYQVEVTTALATVGEVTEAFFEVFVPPPFDEPVGVKLSIRMLHGSEGKYSMACPLLAAEPGESTTRLILGHDEHPTRIQFLRAVQVVASEPVVISYEAHRGDRDPTIVEGRLADISPGSASLQTADKIPVRMAVLASFSVGGETFADVRCVVLDCFGPPAGPYRLRIELQGLGAGDEERLTRAIATLGTTPLRV